MPLKKVNKVIIEPYHFIVGDTYFSVENPQSALYPDDSVVITREDAVELVQWMQEQLNGERPVIQKRELRVDEPVVAYDPGERRAAQTEPTVALRPGESAEVVDLGAIKGGVPKGKIVREGVEVHVPTQPLVP